MARHGAHRDRVVVDRQAVAEQQGVGVGGAQHALDHGVVMLGDGAGPAPHRLDAVSAGTQLGRLLGAQQVVPGADRIGRHEIGEEALPVVAILVAQDLDPALLGVIARRLHRIEDEERAAPPPDLVIAEIADAIGAALVGGDEGRRDVAHRRLGGRIERVEPMEAGEPSELEVGDRRQLEEIRRQRPSAGAVEAPGCDAPARYRPAMPRARDSSAAIHSRDDPASAASGSRRRAR